MAHMRPARTWRHAIGFALHHPSRTHYAGRAAGPAKIGSFEFRAPMTFRWPALR